MNLNTPAARSFITPLKPLAATAIAARVIAEDLRARVDAIANEILANGVYVSEYDGAIIAERAKAWTMGEAAHKAYCVALEAQIAAAGMVAPPTYCPALVAEQVLQDAEHALLEAGRAIPGCERVTVSRLLCSGTKDRPGLETLALYIETLIKLAIAA